MQGLCDRAGSGVTWHDWSELVTAEEEIWRTKVFRKPTAHSEQSVCQRRESRHADWPSQLVRVGVLGRTYYYPIPFYPHRLEFILSLG